MIKGKSGQKGNAVSVGEKELFALFDYQHFENDPVLKMLIDEAEGECGAELPDDLLSQVCAAGEARPDKKRKDRGDDEI